MDLARWWEELWRRNTWGDGLAAIATAAGLFLILVLLRKLVEDRLARSRDGEAAPEGPPVRIPLWTLLLVAAFAATLPLDLPGNLFGGNSLRAWLGAVAVMAGSYAVLQFIRDVLVERAGRLAAKTSNRLDDALVDLLKRTHTTFLLVTAVYSGAQVLALPEMQAVLWKIAVLAFIAQGGIWGNRFLTLLVEGFLTKGDADVSKATSLAAFQFLGRLALWSVLLLFALDNLGVEITGLLAGIGIGGVAIALAVQNILSDLFASLSIVLDKPFEIGDFIILGDYLGTVEHIGLKTTRLRSLSGEQIVIANGDLLGSRIRNYKRMQERRIVFGVGVTYQTPADKLEAIPGWIREAVESQAHTRFDRSHFRAYGDFALLYETVYFMTVPDYNAYMDVQHAVNLALFRKFEAEKVEFAYPTQTLFVRKEG